MKQIITKISEWVLFLFLAYILFIKGVELASIVMDLLSVYSVVLEWIVGIILIIPTALIFANKLTKMIKDIISKNYEIH